MVPRQTENSQHVLASSCRPIRAHTYRQEMGQHQPLLEAGSGDHRLVAVIRGGHGNRAVFASTARGITLAALAVVCCVPSVVSLPPMAVIMPEAPGCTGVIIPHTRTQYQELTIYESGTM